MNNIEFTSVQTIQPGQYYRLREDAKRWEAEQITEDRMYLVIEYRHQTVKLLGIFPEAESEYNQEQTWTCPEDEFFEDFEYSQDASDKRQKLLEEIVATAHEPLSMDQEVARELQAIQNNPQALLEGPQGAKKAADTQESSEGTDLACTPQEQAAMTQRDQMAKVRNLVQRKRNEIAKRNKRMQLAMREKTALMRAKMEGLMAIVQSMEYMVHAMNVYLGIGEEFGIIFDGDRAPSTEKLVVRQLVLFADEESTLFFESGGIDFRNFQDFVNWMKEDWSRVEVMIPEPKGVVAIKMRRSDKHYSDDPMVNAGMNAENKQTWFLVRNGQNLFYVWPEFNVMGDRLYPAQRDLDRIFMEDSLLDDQDRPIRPGEHRWVEAVDKANKQKKEMMVGLLFLQGLMDRTDIFMPFENNVRPNLADPEEHDKFVRYLRDAEMLVSDGRPSWRAYQHTINSRLRVGCRVVGKWPFNTADNARCTPRHYRPDDKACYTISRQDAEGCYFKFEIPYWSKTQQDNVTRNISWQILDEDHDCFINIDEVNEEDLLHYMKDRMNRHAYLDMFPVIKRAINHLRQEREDEKPFRMLVAGEVGKKHGIDISWDDPMMDKMLNWWKFKAKERRSILLDDAKALRMIVGRFGQWKHRHDQAASLYLHRDDVIAAIKRQHSDVMFIGADDQGQVTAFVPRYDDRSVWYFQHFFKASDYSKKPVDPKLSADPWADTSYPVIYSNKRWNNWEKWDRGHLTLTDEDQVAIIDWAQQNLPKTANELRSRWHSHRVDYKDQVKGIKHPGACFRLIAAVQHGYSVHFWIQDHMFVDLKGDHVGSGPTLSRVKANWTRDGRTNQVKLAWAETKYNDSHYARISVEPGHEPWRSNGQCQIDGRVFWIDKSSEDRWYQDHAAWKTQGGQVDSSIVRKINDLVDQHIFDVRYTWICEYARLMRERFMERALGDAEQCEEWVKKELRRTTYSSTYRGMPVGPHLKHVPEAIWKIARAGIYDDNSSDAYRRTLKNLENMRDIKTTRELLTSVGWDIDDDTFDMTDGWKADKIPFLDVPLDWGDYTDCDASC